MSRHWKIGVDHSIAAPLPSSIPFEPLRRFATLALKGCQCQPGSGDDHVLSPCHHGYRSAYDIVLESDLFPPNDNADHLLLDYTLGKHDLGS